MVADPFGRITAELPALDEALVVADLPAEALRRARATYPLLRDTNLELVHREVERLRRRRYELTGDPGHRAEEDIE